MTYVIDCSIVIRLLSNVPGDDLLRRRLSRTVHAPALIDAEVSSVARGLNITTKPSVRISDERAQLMLTDYSGLRIVRHPMQPLQHRAFTTPMSTSIRAEGPPPHRRLAASRAAPARLERGT